MKRTATTVSTLRSASRVVVKIGSALVASGLTVQQDWLDALARDVAALRKRGQEVLIVSSGAIALGRGYFSDEKPHKLADKQAAAALGQPLLMAAMARAFKAVDLNVAQSLLTLEDTENRRRWLNARATLDVLLGAGIIPVINENDTIATDEIRYGDNDRLAARVAQMVSADVLVLLSDIDGLYTADPRIDPTAQHISVLRDITPEHDEMAGDPNADAGIGSGGMATKIAAARIAWQAGCATVITLGKRERPLMAIEKGATATWLLPPFTPAKAREIWLQGHLTPEGAFWIDAGAVKALEQGASLLPVGLKRVEGRFDRGAAVAVKAMDGQVIAKGVTAYASDDAARIAGMQSDAVEAALGQRGRPALIHRDDLVRQT